MLSSTARRVIKEFPTDFHDSAIFENAALFRRAGRGAVKPNTGSQDGCSALLREIAYICSEITSKCADATGAA